MCGDMYWLFGADILLALILDVTARQSASLVQEPIYLNLILPKKKKKKKLEKSTARLALT